MSVLQRLSVEVFPPKTDEAEVQLFEALAALHPLAPDYVSVTYGAGGSTQARSLGVVARLVEEHQMDVAAHLTCVGQTRAEVDALARDWWAKGVRRIVALRGDAQGQGGYHPHPEGYENAADLTAGLKRIAPFQIAVGAYPEKHPDSPDMTACLENLKRKQDAGADYAITQFFFDADMYLSWLDRARAAGITLPMIPGIMPILSFTGLQRFAAQCQASIPAFVADAFEKAGDDKAAQRAASIDLCAALCDRLIDAGVEHLHFYTLNKADLTLGVAQALGYAPARTAA
jgi:methylenetetrahydrofolate reductase (NADPH)